MKSKAALLVAAVLVALVVVVVVVAPASARVVSDTFSNLEQHGNDEALVLFYRSGNEAHRASVELLESVSESMSGYRPSTLTFRKCDGDDSANRADFDRVGFGNEVYWFTTTPSSGIEKYNGPVSEALLEFHVRSKFLDYSPSDVDAFTNSEELYDSMDEDEGRPIFVKFFEQWCTHCKALAPTFARGASFFRDEVRFVEVECSKNDDTRDYCNANDVKSYPVLMLLTGEEKIKYDSGERNLVAFDAFFAKRISGYKSKVAAADATGEKKKGKKKKKKKAAAAGAAAAAASTETDSKPAAATGSAAAPSSSSGGRRADSDEVEDLRKRVAELEVALEELRRTSGGHTDRLNTVSASVRDMDYKVKKLWSGAKDL